MNALFEGVFFQVEVFILSRKLKENTELYQIEYKYAWKEVSIDFFFFFETVSLQNSLVEYMFFKKKFFKSSERSSMLIYVNINYCFCVYYKTRQNFITKHSSFLLQNEANFITKRGRYYKTGQVYYKTGQVLQNEAIITKRGITTATRCT